MFFPISGVHINPFVLGILGLVIGILGGFFGVGGSFLSGPSLFSLGMPYNFVVGTDLIHIVGKSIVAARQHRILGHIDLKPWIDVMAINVTANFQLIRCMEPLLKQSDAGRAVFVTSGAASKALAYMGPYAASKAALDTLVRVWANETASTHLRVNLFSPGPIRTRMRAQVFPGEDPMTLDTPDQVAEFIVPMCAPEWTETGKLYDYKARKLSYFHSPA